jgi:DNA repair exonuclease SbcCD nuclease subunit
MSIKILATGDLHIGQKVSGLPENAGSFSARDTWKRIVEWSIENQADVIALTGDIVDRDNRFFEAIGPLQSGFARLKENDIQVYIVSGNHDFDVLPQIIRSGKLDNVHLLGAGGVWELKTFSKGSEAVQFAGWSFPSQYVREDPLKLFNLYDIDPDIPSIGLLHGEANTPLSSYAPINPANFMNLKVSIWILGHIHKPQVLNNAAPYICYPGSPLAFSSKETDMHGPLLITVSQGLIGKPERILVSPVRFENLMIDITGSDSEENLRRTLFSGIIEKADSMDQELQEVVYLVYDITLTGAHNNIRLIESWSHGLAEDFEHETAFRTKIIVRNVGFDIQPGIRNLEELAAQNSPLGILAQTILAIKQNRDTDFLKQLYDDWKEKYSLINAKDTYLPLNKGKESDNDMEATGKQYILKESARLLGELLHQKN